ncbi:MerR family transcriptional regulator [Kibdelosporangium aridum]|uniref:Mercuric resistance operon regulatory protein n=1 Tax=Kibdelosporangium aridum TaxID=2030 RepID=A0A1Y5Y087_KIBAR|nr:MerR family DNA-binding protein [Kibdelosporangium aridum]SMD22946.1 Hg(II)-responsive transcriptional regulator [Kibdelosporangium aridum]
MRTSELAAQAGVNPQTLRYYERLGLLPEPGRTPGGYRSYPPEAVRLVRFVKRAQELGFTLSDIADLLHLAEGGPQSCAAARDLAANKVVDLNRRIADLVAMRDALEQLVATCAKPRELRDCPILGEIARQSGHG